MIIKIGFENPKRKLPSELLTQARDVMLKLVDDPDPDVDADRPATGYMGHNDPITVALNHVRPVALSALIEYAWQHYMMTKDVASSDENNTDRSYLEERSSIRSILNWISNLNRAELFIRFLASI